MKVITDENGIVQITVEGIAEEQVVIKALEFYAINYKHKNPKHQNLAFEMFEQVQDEYIKDVKIKN